MKTKKEYLPWVLITSEQHGISEGSAYVSFFNDELPEEQELYWKKKDYEKAKQRAKKNKQCWIGFQLSRELVTKIRMGA